MCKRHVCGLIAILLAMVLGAFAVGCEDPGEVPPAPQQPERWSPPEEQPRQPREPAEPENRPSRTGKTTPDDDAGQPGEQDSLGL